MSNPTTTSTTADAGQVTGTVLLTYPLELTPKTRRPKRDALYRASAEWGLNSGRARLLHEAARLERLAARNEREGKENGARSKRYRASQLTAAASLLAEVERQILSAAVSGMARAAQDERRTDWKKEIRSRFGN